MDERIPSGVVLSGGPSSVLEDGAPRLDEAVLELGVPILAGVEYVRARTKDDWDLFNAAMVVTPDAGLHPTWSAKAYLVPFTEKLPMIAR